MNNTFQPGTGRHQERKAGKALKAKPSGKTEETGDYQSITFIK
jgi:hypothetical protein